MNACSLLGAGPLSRLQRKRYVVKPPQAPCSFSASTCANNLKSPSPDQHHLLTCFQKKSHPPAPSDSIVQCGGSHRRSIHRCTPHALAIRSDSTSAAAWQFGLLHAGLPPIGRILSFLSGVGIEPEVGDEAPHRSFRMSAMFLNASLLRFVRIRNTDARGISWQFRTRGSRSCG